MPAQLVMPCLHSAAGEKMCHFSPGFLDLVAAANAPTTVDGEGGAQAMIVRDAHGVVAVVSPWNFPADEMLLLALPALVAGNAVVFKPSEVAPLVGAKARGSAPLRALFWGVGVAVEELRRMDGPSALSLPR